MQPNLGIINNRHVACRPTVDCVNMLLGSCKFRELRRQNCAVLPSTMRPSGTVHDLLAALTTMNSQSRSGFQARSHETLVHCRTETLCIQYNHRLACCQRLRRHKLHYFILLIYLLSLRLTYGTKNGSDCRQAIQSNGSPAGNCCHFVLLDKDESWRLAVWLSGNSLASINVVALRQTRLVPGWVTVCGRVNHLCM